MAANQALDYGLDIAGIADADELWSETSGLPLVIQDAVHRITIDDVLGPDGQGWGFDVRRLVGSKAADLNKYGPILSEVLTRDDRIQTADVTLTETRTAAGQADLLISIHCETAFGPFDLTKPVSQLTENYLEGQA